MRETREQKEAVEEIRRLGGSALYDAQLSTSGPAWLRNQLGEDFFETVVNVHFASPTATDAGMECLKKLSRLRTLRLSETEQATRAWSI